MNIFKKPVILLALFAFSFGAQATTIQQSTTGLTGSFTTETFDIGVAGSLAANQYSGLTLGSNLYINNSYSGVFPNMNGNVISNFYDPYFNCCVSPTFVSFSGVVSGAAFNFVSNTGTSTFAAYLGNNMVEEFSAPTGYGGEFYGFTNVLFDSIRIDSGGSNTAYLLDNLQVAASVPEPATYTLLLAGLGLLVFTARRRKNNAV